MVKFINIDELAEMWAVPRSWLYRRCRERQIPHLRIGKYIRFKKEDVERWLKEQQKQK